MNYRGILVDTTLTGYRKQLPYQFRTKGRTINDLGGGGKIENGLIFFCENA